MRWRISSIVLMVAITFWFSRHYIVDDGLIYARYVRNALDGYGMVFNPGERVNALTSPLFAAFVLGLSWLLHGHVILAEFLLCGVFLVLACLVAEHLVPWAGVLIASTDYFYGCIGMETFLFLLMLGLLAVLYLKGNLNWLPIVAVLTVLTRFEGLALVAFVGVQLLRERRWPKLWSCLPAILLLAAYAYSNHAFYGHWLPSSGTAKLEQGLSGYWGRWPMAFLHVGYLIKAVFLPTIYVLPLGLFFAGLGIAKEKGSRMNAVLVPFGLTLGAFYVFFNLPNYHWYYAPFIFFAAIYAVRGLPRSRTAQVCLALVVCDSFGASIYGMRHSASWPDYVAMGTWIRDNTKPDARIAAVETGTLAWYDDRYMDDLMGLTTPANAARIRNRDLFSWLPEQRPDYVVIHIPNPFFGEIAAEQSPDYAYVPVHFGHIYLMKRKDSTR